MDWYYPVLGGALRGAGAAERIARGWDAFVVPGLGVRCVSDQPWVTVAETCELAISLDACGQRERARELLATAGRLRHEDGSYWTGWQYVNENHFPAERSSWTSAAVVLAADALDGFSGGAAIFRASPPRPGQLPAARRPRRLRLRGHRGGGRSQVARELQAARPAAWPATRRGGGRARPSRRPARSRGQAASLTR